jgi:osmoprotectant transport system substrate-binding protein
MDRLARRPRQPPLVGLVGRVGLVALVVGVLLLSACDPVDPSADAAVVIGVGSTLEQQVLAALTVAALTDAGMETRVLADLGATPGLRRQAIAGEVDVFWDYTGAAWALGLGQQNPPAEPLESFQRVRQEDQGNGLTWLEPSSANATLALFVDERNLPPTPEPNGMGWLAGKLSIDEEALCVDDDFRRRPGGLEALATAYPMDLGRLEVVSADEGTAIRNVAEGRCFAGLATATSGEARNAGLVPVEDELGVFPAFVVAPVARTVRLLAQPEIEAALDPVVEGLDTMRLAELNAEAARGAVPEELARRFLAALPPAR